MRPSKVVTGSSGTHKRKAFNLAVQFKSIWPEIIFIYPWENSGGKSVLIVSSLHPFYRHLTITFHIEKKGGEKRERERKKVELAWKARNGSMTRIRKSYSSGKEIQTNLKTLPQVSSTWGEQIVYRLISDSWPLATILHRNRLGTTVQTRVIQFRQTRPDYAFVDTCSRM